MFWRYRRNIALALSVVRETTKNKICRASHDEKSSRRTETVVDAQISSVWGPGTVSPVWMGFGKQEMAQSIPGVRHRWGRQEVELSHSPQLKLSVRNKQK